MNARGATRAFIGRLPWWGSALIGVAVIVILTVPQAARFGSGGHRNYGWYTTHDEQLLTGLILDQVQYTRLVDAASGHAPSSEIAPFTSRALAPWLASRLPLGAATALTVVNVLSLALGTFALALLAMDLTRGRGATLAAVAVWAVSFPVLRYTGVAFVDPATVGLIPVVLLFMWRRWVVPALVVFAASIWMKETALAALPVALTFEWMRPGVARAWRGAMCGLWIVVAVGAYVSAGVLGGDHLIVFASWVPESLEVVKRMALLNALTLPRLIAYGVTVLPAVFAVAMWWRARRRGSSILLVSDSGPLVIGCLAGAVLGVSALPTAVLDGRTVWTTLAPASILVAAWVAGSDWSSAWADVRGFVRGAVIPIGVLGVLWVAMVALVPMPTGPGLVGADYQPRFAGVPDVPEKPLFVQVDGRGDRTVAIPGDGPALVEFDSEAPIILSNEDTDLIDPGRSTRGITLFDPVDDRTLHVSADGSWKLIIRSVSSALFWESISPLTGQGPNVVVFPGGLPNSIDLQWTSSDPDARVRLVGGCHLGQCGDLDHDDVIPPGTEAVVIDAAGAWTLIPSYDPDRPEPPVLEGTVARETEAPGSSGAGD